MQRTGGDFRLSSAARASLGGREGGRGGYEVTTPPASAEEADAPRQRRPPARPAATPVPERRAHARRGRSARVAWSRCAGLRPACRLIPRACVLHAQELCRNRAADGLTFAKAGMVPGMSLTEFQISFPDVNDDRDQDGECCDVVIGTDTERIRFHDYGTIYSIPGLYEQLFYEHLRCQSPAEVCSTLAAELGRAGVDPDGLRVLDLGAGNGMVGERIADLGAAMIVGVDILPEAAEAAERDHPGVYDDYLVADLTALSNESRTALTGPRFNCLVAVAALGFGDIPPEAFATAFDAIEDDG